ncbi:MAG TPA: serine hydrolase domain-containing protein, partial [Flavisolibacter sp.]|nr:serine hydrolase domain-containing protein [Flavisolibacter sp.]
MRKFFFLLFNLSTIVLMAQNSLTRRLDSLTSVYESNNYHGVILVAKGGQVLFQKGYGMANFEKGIKQTPGTLFKMESTGKMFTATAIMQLVEQGKLRLDQTLKELLPQLSIKNADQITVQHLLRHTSGLMSPWDHPQWNFKKVYTKEELMKIVTEVPLVFDQPGKSWFYSNSGYFILGWIIEKVSGQP